VRACEEAERGVGPPRATEPGCGAEPHVRGLLVQIRKRYWRAAAAALASAVLAGAIGAALVGSRFGDDDRASLARIEAELRGRFDQSAATLGAVAARIVDRGDLVRAAAADEAARKSLFDALRDAIPAASAATTGLTAYGASGVPIAWAGRASDLPKERVQGPAALFVAPDALGPRLVRIEPIFERPPGKSSLRIGSIAVEQLLGALPIAPGPSDTFVMPASLAPVSVRVRLGQSAAPSPYSFVIPSASGQALVEAHVEPSDLAEARGRWRSRTVGAVAALLGLTVLLCASPFIESRLRSRATPAVVTATLGLVVMLALGRFLLHFAAVQIFGERNAAPADLLLWALLLVAYVWIAIDLLDRRRVARPRPRLRGGDARTIARVATAYLAAGALAAALLWAYARFLQNVVSRTNLDLLHFSLHPLSASRLAVGFGLILLHASVIWCAAMVARSVAVVSRHRRTTLVRTAAVGGWIGGAAIAVAIARQTAGPVPDGPLLVALAAAGMCEAALSWPRARVRRASQAARLAAVFGALVLPSLATYPSLHAFTIEAKERLIAEAYGPEAIGLRYDLQESLNEALEQIDALPSLSAFLTEPQDEDASNDAAYQIWSTTDLATERLTSAVELYGADGRLVSRFALNLPEYTTPSYRAAACGWDIIDENSPLGSSERHVLRASRGICEGGRQIGTIAVRAMLDYRTLPFISSQSPYLESLRFDRQEPAEGAAGRDVEFVQYGWSRAPLYVSRTSAWPLSNEDFDRATMSRERFWDVQVRDGREYRVYYLNDRGGIYALGYPVLTPLGHLVNLAELVTLAFVLYVLLLIGATLFNAATSRTPASGRALLREVRSSFYHKLFLAFVLVAVLPVVILAFATRTYFTAQFNVRVEESALQTATVAQRLVEDYATLQRRQTGAQEGLDDSVMVVVGHTIDQAVNLFDGDELEATSERDLFASRLLPTRTPAEVYRHIVLERLPTFVGVEQVGDLSYLVAAAPVRASGREGVVTVPQTLHRQESEQQSDELDRRVLSALVVFVLFGAAFGYWMAETIADPVNRLTRATRRIARGDLDARVAATSTDELRRLVEDFNRMAADLKRQRSELERTQRLEAWADMARQVAHDIKNPLTPIQLSAEHARRVNVDRGRPLSPVLDDCVNAILNQVKLLRQISAEFSSFASSPTARPEPTDVPRLIDEVVEPYRTALAGRVALDVQASADVPQIAIDRTLFARALTNVIENALHAMPGGGRLSITTGVDADSRTLMVSIADTGVGMDQEAAAKIFEPYFSTKATGTGLGLTIAKRNVELNGGTIAVESRRGVGTTVTIALPIPDM
jgi:signal transduction histidine kinase